MLAYKTIKFYDTNTFKGIIIDSKINSLCI